MTLRKRDYFMEEKTLKWGFDLTDFKPGRFQSVLDALGISKSPTRNPSNVNEFVWNGKGIIVYTTNNPITGEYYRPGKENEKNFVGYIGIEGDESLVKKAVTLIKRNALVIKGESKFARSFV